MSYVIASERESMSYSRHQYRTSHVVPNTEYLDLEYDSTKHALWIYLSTRAPTFVSLELIQDLLSVDTAFATALAANHEHEPPIEFKIIASKRPGVFSLGGDLASFRYHIDQRNRNALSAYANAALDAIWTNAQGSGIDGLTSVSLVQGEAQGGGFEAALAAHVLVAEKGAMFGFPEALFGMFPGMGGFALLAARTNVECARRLIGSTNRYSAEMLYEMGVVDVLAEQGKGQERLNEWIHDASPETTSKLRNRFSSLDREQLSDTLDEWVEQALCLSPRQLRTMGYILDAQKRASVRKSHACVVPLRRKIEFSELYVGRINKGNREDTISPLLVAPQSTQRHNESEFLAFIRGSRPWIHENLTRNGALALRGFPTQGVTSLNRLTAALRTDRAFRPAQSVPTPVTIHDNIHEDNTAHANCEIAPFNAYSNCTLFPAFKLVSFADHLATPTKVSLVNTRAVYNALDNELVREFEHRGLTYYRTYPSALSFSSSKTGDSLPVHCWENVFKTQKRIEAELKCRANGLAFHWTPDGAIEVWNSAPACITHRESGDRLWFNQVYHVKATSKAFERQTSLWSKLTKLISSPVELDVRFSDGAVIDQAAVDEIAMTHEMLSVDIELEGTDVLILDNALVAQGRYALDNERRCYIALY